MERKKSSCYRPMQYSWTWVEEADTINDHVAIKVATGDQS